MVSTSIRRAAAKKLRANTTPHERKLWRALKEIPIEGSHFRRQAPIGRYIVDFFCPAKRLILEIDGGHHNRNFAGLFPVFDMMFGTAHFPKPDETINIGLPDKHESMTLWQYLVTLKQK